jgi:hypothetical protein
MAGTAAQRTAQAQEDEPGDNREKNDIDYLKTFVHRLLYRLLLTPWPLERWPNRAFMV